MSTKSWAERLAEFLILAFNSTVPVRVLNRASLQVFDTLACAAGAQDSRPFRSTLRAIDGSSPEEATVWFAGRAARIDDATLANGTAVRFLDANDVFLGGGPGGHPSDNIPVAIAAGQRFGSSGRDVLTAIVLGYELVYRLRTEVFRRSPRGSDWHEVSISGGVAASMTGLLAGADSSQLANAISIGTAKGYALKEIRRGQISMLKAAGNAVVAREGVMSAILALNGLTGPRQIFEGESGLVATLGAEASQETIERLCAPPEWAIQRISIKPFPAFGTSQAAIVAAASLSAQLSGSGAIKRVEVRLRDSRWTHDYIGLAERRMPRTRETADHSIHFLVAVALLEGGISQTHYEEKYWEKEEVRDLMARISVLADGDLGDAGTSFPASVRAVFDDGGEISETVRDTPGSPRNPWGVEQISEKFARLDRAGLGRSRIRWIAEAVQNLQSAPDLGDLVAAIE